MKWIKDVVKFHTKMKISHEGESSPKMEKGVPIVRHLPQELHEARIGFIEEELREYCQAYVDGELEPALDALVDLIYVVLGTAHLHGFTPELFDEAWKRVQRANMTKLPGVDHPELLKDRGFDMNGTDVVKPDDWEAPTFADLLVNECCCAFGRDTCLLHRGRTIQGHGRMSTLMKNRLRRERGELGT